MNKIRLFAAANTMAPCYYALLELGYTVENEMIDDLELWHANKEDQTLSAIDPCMLLGLAKIIEMRGQNWRVSDEKIELFLERHFKIMKRNPSTQGKLPLE